MPRPKTGLKGLKVSKENPITKESLTGAVKRIMQAIEIGPESGNFANSTTYPRLGGITKAGRLVSAKIAMGTAPSTDTNTVVLKRGSNAGTTLLAGASQSLTAIAAGAFVDLPLSAVAADLLFDGTVPVYAHIAQGAPAVPGANAVLILEFELNDFVAA